ncbi:hypothetical protein [Sphingobium sp. OAS761]|uniref:hypothetical protein n=1 Tax=Sphingobium sp. OAS761 TaxID=2817901 RepID=UPI0020A20340|nr:hypothetical protein [Sphingobium sp. OAS761]
MLSTGTVVAATAMGIGLAGYATSPQRSPTGYDDAPLPEMPVSFASGEADTEDVRGPVVIHCTGCGPTLADRRFAADMAGLDSYGMVSATSDPVVRDYMDDAPPEAEPAAYRDPAPSPMHYLPPRIERFMRGELADARVTSVPVRFVTVARGAVDDTAPAGSGRTADAAPDSQPSAGPPGSPLARGALAAAE